jgi:importin subunit beta-1
MFGLIQAMYCLLLSQELANEQSAESVRISAGLALKNTLKAKDLTRREVLQQKWVAIDQNTKSQVKAAVKSLFSIYSGIFYFRIC